MTHDSTPLVPPVVRISSLQTPSDSSRRFVTVDSTLLLSVPTLPPSFGFDGLPRCSLTTGDVPWSTSQSYGGRETSLRVFDSRYTVSSLRHPWTGRTLDEVMSERTPVPSLSVGYRPWSRPNTELA